MQIFVKLPSGRTITPEVEGTDTVEAVCEKVYRLSEDARAHPSLLTLVHDGQKLDKRRTLADCGIGKEAALTGALGQGVRVVELTVGGQRCSRRSTRCSPTPLSDLRHVRAHGARRSPSTPPPPARGGCSGGGRRRVPGARRAGGAVVSGADGAYFIDRDPVCFRYILNHLRDVSSLLADAVEPEPGPGRGAGSPFNALSVPDSVGERPAGGGAALRPGRAGAACSGGRRCTRWPALPPARGPA